jgi:hypothetical protein
LRWFKSYNEQQKPGERVFPFGFLLSLQAKSRPQMAKDEPQALSDGLGRRRDPRPAAPFFKRALRPQSTPLIASGGQKSLRRG